MVAIPIGRMPPDVRLAVESPVDLLGRWPYGRLVLPTKQHTEPVRSSQKKLFLDAHRNGNLHANDILGIRLYQGCLEPGPPPPRNMLPLEDFNETVAALKDIGSSVYGVNIGNQGYELSYRHFYDNWDGNWKGNLGDCREFMLRVGDILHGFGARLVFSFMDWELLQDAYKGDGILLETLKELDAVNYTCSGHSIVPGTFVDKEDARFTEQMNWQSREMERGWSGWKPGDDLHVVRDYLMSGEFWSGVGGANGVMAGNMAVMYEFGYSGFVVDVPKGDLTLVHSMVEAAATGRIE